MQKIKEYFSQPNSVRLASLTVAFFSLASRLIGLFRDRLLAARFGATNPIDAYHSLDVYYAAFKIPDFIYSLLILGALSAAFIPIFTEHLTQKKHAEAFRVANSVLNLAVIVMGVVSVIIFIFMPYLVKFLVPGFSDPAKIHATISVTRLMLLSPIFFGISNVAGGILNSYKKFFSYSIAPVLYNLGIILGIVLFSNKIGIFGPAIGVIFGALLHMFIQLISAFRLGFRYQAIVDLKSAAVRKIGKLMIPRVAGIAASQIDILVGTIIASTLASGSIAIINLANNLQSFPVGLFGVALSVAIFPTLSEAMSRNEPEEFVRNFSKVFRSILYLILPASALIIVLRAQIVRLILGAGLFGWTDTKLTAATLGVYSISLFAQALIPLIARAFYAMQDTRTPLKIAIWAVIVDIAGSLFFTRPFVTSWLAPFAGIRTLGVDSRVIGLAIAFSISTSLNVFLLFRAINHKLKILDRTLIYRSAFKIVLASFIAGLLSYLGLHLIAPFINTHTGPGLALQAGVALIFGIFGYVVLSLLFKLEELNYIIRFSFFKNYFKK